MRIGAIAVLVVIAAGAAWVYTRDQQRAKIAELNAGAGARLEAVRSEIGDGLYNRLVRDCSDRERYKVADCAEFYQHDLVLADRIVRRSTGDDLMAQVLRRILADCKELFGDFSPPYPCAHSALMTAALAAGLARLDAKMRRDVLLCVRQPGRNGLDVETCLDDLILWPGGAL